MSFLKKLFRGNEPANAGPSAPRPKITVAGNTVSVPHWDSLLKRADGSPERRAKVIAALESVPVWARMAMIATAFIECAEIAARAKKPDEARAALSRAVLIMDGIPGSDKRSSNLQRIADATKAPDMLDDAQWVALSREAAYAWSTAAVQFLDAAEKMQR